MQKVLFVYSGEGTSDTTSGYALLRYSPKWRQIGEILQRRLGLDLATVWQEQVGRHRCPHSPLLTLTAQICQADLWARWGYRPDMVIGHSIGELAAAYQAGLYDLETVVMLAHTIGTITARLEGAMRHGLLGKEEMDGLPAHISSLNFSQQDKTHVTVCGSPEEIDRFDKTHPDFAAMRLPHPWHHPDYARFFDQLDAAPSNTIDAHRFVSGVTTRFATQLDQTYWQRWLTGTVDFISAMATARDQLGDDPVTIIEIGFHPVLEQCCRIFPRHTYASSMFRGEDDIEWILHQRRQLDQAPFLAALKPAVDSFKDGLDYNEALAYQGFTSLTFVQFTEVIEPFFPSLAPQDFFRYKSIDQLIANFGRRRQDQRAVAAEPQRNEVVIAGMSCRFPKSVETLPQFWQMLQGRTDQVGADAGRAAFQAGFLDDRISRFDHAYFGIAAAEAETMDPQQILALELTELLWKDAGLDPATLDRKRIGVYLGAWNLEFDGHRTSVYYPTGTNPSIIAARISYHYDLRGPSWVSNTACSSSLVAVHYAAKDIEAGRVDVAIAGGVNMILGHGFTDIMRNAGFLSKNDRCKTFAEAADGYARAEGGGLVLLANRAVTDKYYAVLSGSAVNQNGGRAQTLTAPHPEAQEEVILAACESAGIAPQQISFLECHGTGTKIGDPIEVSALQNTVARDRIGTCYLGSVKSNLGHLESAAGIAGLIKSALALNQGTIPPNLHFDRPNPFIDFDSHQLQVVSAQTPIDREAFVGVSSFGFGGTNAHVILKGAGDAERKGLQPVTVPFDRGRALPLSRFFPEADAVAPPQAVSQENEIAEAGATDGDVRLLIERLFFDLTGIETIDPELALVEQGLDSMSATELVSLLEEKLSLELDPDLLFDHPLIDQLAAAIEEKLGGGEVNQASNATAPDAPPDHNGREDIARKINALFFSLTSIEAIDPEVELTEQGLDSMSITELISQLEEDLKIDLDPDIVFEFPLVDQLVDEIYAITQRVTVAN